MEKNDVGILLNPEAIKLHRKYFQQMCDMIGIKLIYRAPRENKHYNGYGELDSYYYDPIVIGCIFDEHPTIWTMKKLGWNSESQENVSIVHLPYDTPNVQVGSLVIVPSGIDNTKGRLFKVLEMSTISVYPASITCKIGPIWESTFEETQLDHRDNNFSLLRSEEEDED